MDFRILILLTSICIWPTAISGFWVDDFNSLDTNYYLIQLYTFPANGCNMREKNVVAIDGMLRIYVTKAEDTTDRKYDGGDLGDEHYRLYGLYRTRMRPSKMKGSVSAFYIMNKWVAKDWEHKEIDIEFLGKNPTKIQLTNHDFQNGGKDWKSASRTVNLEFDFSADFHEYAILWMHDTVRWFVDGKLLHSKGQYVPHEPLEIRMNYYIGNPMEKGVQEWLGPIDTTSIPDSTEYDWVRYDPLDSLPHPYSAFVNKNTVKPVRKKTNKQSSYGVSKSLSLSGRVLSLSDRNVKQTVNMTIKNSGNRKKILWIN